MAEPIYELRPRQITEEDQQVWIPPFSCGSEWWEREVHDFLRNDAWDNHQRGDSRTTVFSRAGTSEIVGFVSTTALMLKTTAVKAAVGFTDADEPSRKDVPAVHLLYFGVDEKYQHGGNGQEIWVQFLEGLEYSPLAPRFVHLEVWEPNIGAIRFYERNHFVVLGKNEKPIPDGSGKKATLVRMILNRFKILS